MKVDKAFASLGHPTRLKILEAVLKHSPATLQFISSMIQVPLPNVSHHLKIMTDAGLLNRRTSGSYSMFTFNADVFSTLVIYLGRVVEKEKGQDEAIDNDVQNAATQNPSVRPTGDREDRS